MDDPYYYEIFYSPQVKIRTPWEPVEFTEIPIEIISRKTMPYAVTLWYDFNRFRIEHIDGAQYFGPIEKQVVLLRINLKKGMNKIFVQLAKI